MRSCCRRIILLSAMITSTLHAGEWPAWRGDGNGTTDEKSLPIRWSSTQQIAWKAHVPGYGWSCPIVWGQRVFLTTVVAEDQKAPVSNGPGGGPKEAPAQVHSYQVHCLDAATGRTLWKQTAAQRTPPYGTHVSNTFASETPVTDGQRVYACFGNIGVFCYDSAGQPLWSRDLGSYKVFANWGTSSSLAFDTGRLFVQCDNDQQSFVAALDPATGKDLWRVSRPEKSSWSTPVIWHNKIRTELVLMGTKKVRSYEPSTGKLLWELTTLEGGASGSGSGKGPPGKGGDSGKAAAGGCKSTPISTPGMIYLGMAPKAHGQELGPMWAVRAGASGDISLKPGETSNAAVAWFHPDGGPHFPSAVVHDGLLYVLPPHGGVIRCIDANTGKDIYRQLLPGASDFKSSPWVFDHKVFATDQKGKTFVIQAGKDFSLLGTNDINELTWSTPALAHDSIYLRTVEHLFCIRK